MTPEEIERLEQLVEEMHNYDHELPEGARQILYQISEIVLGVKNESK